MRIRDIPELTDGQVARFWSKVDMSAGPDGCWPWLAGRFPRGYGVFALRPFGSFVSSRLAYQLAYGDLSSDLLVCHECDNPPCCNPAHLFQGTHSDNMQDMLSKGRKVVSPATRAVLSELMKARLASPEARAAMSESVKASWSPELRAAASERAKGRVASPATRAVLSELMKARYASPKARAAASERNKARYASPEARAAMSESVKASWSPELRAAASERAKGRVLSPETRAAISERKKAYWRAKRGVK